jgi:hypothetical protein
VSIFKNSVVIITGENISMLPLLTYLQVLVLKPKKEELQRHERTRIQLVLNVKEGYYWNDRPEINLFMILNIILQQPFLYQRGWCSQHAQMVLYEYWIVGSLTIRAMVSEFSVIDLIFFLFSKKSVGKQYINLPYGIDGITTPNISIASWYANGNSNTKTYPLKH